MKPIPPIFSFLIIAAVCWSRSFAGEVQSPPSLEGSEDRIVTYEPKGKNAHIIVVH